jgi:hypothetical protein
VRLWDDLLDDHSREHPGGEGQECELDDLRRSRTAKYPTAVPSRIGIANEADRVNRVRRGTPWALNPAIVAKPSGMSAGTWPRASFLTIARPWSAATKNAPPATNARTTIHGEVACIASGMSSTATTASTTRVERQTQRAL